MEQEYILHGPKQAQPMYNGSLAQLIFNNMKTRPTDLELMIDGNTGKVVTNREFLQESVNAAAGLRRIGLRPDDIVLFYGEHCTDILFVGLAVLFEGAILAPIDHEVAASDVRHMLSVIRPKFIVCEPKYLNNVLNALNVLEENPKIILVNSEGVKVGGDATTYESLSEATVNVETYTPAAASLSNPHERVIVLASSSGSTGTPKGVELTNRNLLFHMVNWGDKPTPKFLQVTSFFWMTAIMGWIISMTYGMTRVVMRDFTEVEFMRLVQKYKPEWTILTPLKIGQILKHPDLHQYNLTSLKQIHSTGFPLHQATVDLFKQNWKGGGKLVQGFGTTELAGYTNINDNMEKILSIGRLVPGMQVKIIDPDTGKSLPANMSGELCYKSDSVMKGYKGNSEGTKQAIDESGWFHSGDLAYYDEEGFVFITDRIKEIFKFRGHHVSPYDVEAVLEAIDGVKEAGVTGIPHPEDGNHPIALVIPDSPTILESDIIRIYEAQGSKQISIEAGVIFVESLPRTTSGKIKRRDLKKLALELHSIKQKTV